MVSIAVSGLVGFLAYMLLAGSMATSELATGVALALAVAGWKALGRRLPSRRFVFSSPDLRAWGRAIAQLPLQTVIAARFLLRAVIRSSPVPGRADVHPFRFGMVDDPAERGRRATAVLAASLAPASYIVHVEPGRDEALVHSVTALPGGDRERLV